MNFDIEKNAVQEMVNMIDINGDGHIDKDEFIKLAQMQIEQVGRFGRRKTLR